MAQFLRTCTHVRSSSSSSSSLRSLHSHHHFSVTTSFLRVPIRTYVAHTSPLYKGGSWLPRMFRSRSSVRQGGAEGDGLAERFSIFDQDHIPEELRLPVPGDPLNRIGAAVFDATVSAVGGIAAGGVAYGALAVSRAYESSSSSSSAVTGADSSSSSFLTSLTNELTNINIASTGNPSMDISFATAQGAGLALWMLRDGIGDKAGNRSLGKALFGLEIALWDGSIASPLSCLTRNWYFGLLPLTLLHPLFGMGFEVLLFFDAASFAITPDARRAGDYLWGTRVVNERPGREERLEDMYEAQEIAELREEIESLSPGTLATLPTQAWYDLAISYPPSRAGRSSGAERNGREGEVGEVEEGAAVTAQTSVSKNAPTRTTIVTMSAEEASAAARAAALAPARGVQQQQGVWYPIRTPGILGKQVSSSSSSSSATSANENNIAPPSLGGLGGMFSEVRETSAEYVAQKPAKRK